MESKEVIQRLCKLQEEVSGQVGYEHAADCFCGEGGFWEAEGYDGTHDGGYRNDGVALQFIEAAVREKLESAAAIEAERERVRVLREKVLQLCDAIENRNDLPPIKWALKCGRLVNEARDMAALQATAQTRAAAAMSEGREG